MRDQIEYLEPRRPDGGGNVLDLSAEPGAEASSQALAGVAGALYELLRQAADKKASDVHIVPGYPPTFRVDGKLENASASPLRAHEIRQMLDALATDRTGQPLGQRKDLDCAVAVPHSGVTVRFRLNAYRSQGQWCACFRHIAGQVPSLETIGFPIPVVERILTYRNGLVIFTGTTGAGKSTSMAAIIQVLADRARHHVLTIEEPLEFIFRSRKGSLFSQREVGRDVDTFADGLKYGLRQDPDIILVGETRDRVTAQMVLSAAETGHLVFTTLHTRDAKGALTRFVDLFPAESQEDVRKQLAMSLRSVISQQLLAAIGGGRTLVTEVLHVTQAAEVSIRSGRIETLDNVIQTGKRDGMWTFDDDIARLMKAGKLRLPGRA